MKINYTVDMNESKAEPAGEDRRPAATMRPCREDEFIQFIKNYPRPLERDVNQICEPPVVTYNDFTLGNWPESVVAGHSFAGRESHEPADWKIRLPTFTAREWVTGSQGDTAVVELDRDCDRGDLYRLFSRVIIDGKAYEVKGIESFCIRQQSKGQTIGLCVGTR